VLAKKLPADDRVAFPQSPPTAVLPMTSLSASCRYRFRFRFGWSV